MKNLIDISNNLIMFCKISKYLKVNHPNLKFIRDWFVLIVSYIITYNAFLKMKIQIAVRVSPYIYDRYRSNVYYNQIYLQL